MVVETGHQLQALILLKPATQFSIADSFFLSKQLQKPRLLLVKGVLCAIDIEVVEISISSDKGKPGPAIMDNLPLNLYLNMKVIGLEGRLLRFHLEVALRFGDKTPEPALLLLGFCAVKL